VLRQKHRPRLLDDLREGAPDSAITQQDERRPPNRHGGREVPMSLVNRVAVDAEG
jgi:hypothetical protein